MKIKIPLLLAGIGALTISTMTTFNVLDTFVFAHEEGVAQTSENFDFDFDTPTSTSSTSSPTSSESSSSQNQGGKNGTKNSSEEEESSKEENSSKESSQETSLIQPSTSEEDRNHTTVELENSTYLIKEKEVPYHLLTIKLKRLSDLRTRIATNSNGAYGANITQTFGTMIRGAESDQNVHVIGAMSGDFAFWKGRAGYVVRNGVTYRTNKRKTEDNDFAIFKDGTYLVFNEDNYEFDELNAMHGGLYQVWSFGPSLLENGEIKVTTNQEIDNDTMSQNQRSAIAVGRDGTIYFLCTEVNGSRNSSRAASFSLYTLATFFKERDCLIAYNLDGGDSSALYYEGTQQQSAKRNLGDIIYVVDA